MIERWGDSVCVCVCVCNLFKKRVHGINILKSWKWIQILKMVTLSFGHFFSEHYVGDNQFCTRGSKHGMVTKGKSRSGEEEKIYCKRAKLVWLMVFSSDDLRTLSKSNGL